MNKHNLLKLSLYSFIISFVWFAITYFGFHFVTDDGITLIWHEEVGKPFIAYLLGQLAVLFLFASIFALLICFVVFRQKEKK